MRLKDCYRTADFRTLAKKRLPAPIFHYIDGGADDEVTLHRNTSAFESVDLVPNVLTGAHEIDMSVEVLGARLQMPLFLSPTALQRLFHHDGERAIARAAGKFGTMFSVSTLGTRSIEELAALTGAPKLFQIYVHKDPALTTDLIRRCKEAQFDALALTVDAIVAGNRERDYHTGMTTPPKLTPSSLLSCCGSGSICPISPDSPPQDPLLKCPWWTTSIRSYSAQSTGTTPPRWSRSGAGRSPSRA
jgi:L-lactate dehydrogenase (cytochrome)